MNSGVSHHARTRLTARDLAGLGVSCALLGANRSWTTFAVLDDGELAADAMARALDVAVIQIWTSDDHGTTVQFSAPDGWSAELPIAFGDSGKLSAADKQLLADLVKRRVLTDARRAALARALASKPARRDEWLAGGGLEKVLGVADATVVPVPCTSELLAMHAPQARLVKPRKRAAQGTSPPRVVMPAPAAAIDRGVLALHVRYWTEVFQLNGWKLYRRYKKHLPAERRREVDELCNLVAMGAEPADVERAVETILGAVWTADDWSAAIRDPRLASDEGLDRDQLADWQRRLATG